MTGNKHSTAPDWTDPDDAPDLSTPEWQAKMAQAKVARGRPKSDKSKVAVKLRIDPDVLEAYKATGPGWQTRMSEALRKGLGKKPKAA
ncbi:hypothetical protein AA309_20150 [Microvirga vignae]|uniref:BrnA antitoxin of type II toxin-antitoxin system n=1 Tax=Microvirga vignae TaxID=1225564 RepID=A0A0H1R8B6_9HYPH|nr:BrnA antitoxin family protein [Microvirga vignae]KLK91413.1 hypothetical protein AA309_20150 [Microvirga vignae]